MFGPAGLCSINATLTDRQTDRQACPSTPGSRSPTRSPDQSGQAWRTQGHRNNGARSWRQPPTPPPRSEHRQPPPTRARQVAWTQGHQKNGARRRCGNTIQERGLQGVHTAMPLLRHLGTRRSSEAARTSIGSPTICWSADLECRSGPGTEAEAQKCVGGWGGGAPQIMVY